MRLFRRAIHLVSLTPFGDDPSRLFRLVRDLVRAAEDAGFDAVLVPDHVVLPAIGGGPDAPILEAYTFLGALTATTETMALGALVSPVTLHRAPDLIRRVTTLDVASGGRALLGIGAGWDADEHLAYGFGFPGTAARMDLLDDALVTCRAALTGRVPVLVGGAGERRTLAAVARHADACNVSGEPATIRHKFEVVARHCDRIGRDPAEIWKTVMVPPGIEASGMAEVIEERLAVGAQGFVWFASPDLATVATTGAALRRLVP
jgi:alkanesulfonate monooxygenase SsuD/methylene tetrahydromethanopterin reductase-like flavin-dependent oxidoreductase (luciferase family)